jgi:hypothetical protein
VDWPKSVQRKIAGINNFSRTTKKSLKTKRGLLISTHMSPRVICFEIMDLQKVSILAQIKVETWVPESLVNLLLQAKFGPDWIGIAIRTGLGSRHGRK